MIPLHKLKFGMTTSREKGEFKTVKIKDQRIKGNVRTMSVH
jgi:hypothetical protein